MAVTAEPEFMDGFDAYSTSQVFRKWTTALGNPSSILTPGRSLITGTQAMGGFNRMRKTVTSSDLGILQVGFRTPDVITAEQHIMSFYHSGLGGDQLSLLYNSSGVLRLVNVDLTQIGIATDPLQSLASGTWYYIEFAALMNTATGTADVKLNGASVTGLFGLTGKKTSAGTALDTISCSAIGTGSYMDDLYLRVGSTSYNNATDFLGDIVIETLYPDADSSDSGHYQGTIYGGVPTRKEGIDEVNAANDETDGVDLTSNGQKLYSSYGSPSGPPGGSVGTIRAVQMNVIARKTDAGFSHAITPGTFKVGAPGTDYLGTSQALQDTFTDKRKAWATRPDGSGAWTTTDVATGWEWGCQRDS